MNTETGLRALVVYESMFGNTRAVAGAVVEGLRSEGLDATASDVRAAAEPTGYDLLVVGAPTHAFSLSRASTRKDAVKQGAPADTATTGLREWIAAMPQATEGARLAAAFDTRARKVKHLPAAASRKAARLLTKKGYDLVDSHGFLVEDVAGPLSTGQLESAKEWGRKIAAAARNR